MAELNRQVDATTSSLSEKNAHLEGAYKEKEKLEVERTAMTAEITSQDSEAKEAAAKLAALKTDETALVKVITNMNAYMAEVDEVISRSQEEAKEAEIEQLRSDILDGDNKVKANMAAKMKLKIVTAQVIELENSIKASAQATIEQEQRQKSELASIQQMIADVNRQILTVDTANAQL